MSYVCFAQVDTISFDYCVTPMPFEYSVTNRTHPPIRYPNAYEHRLKQTVRWCGGVALMFNRRHGIM